MRLTKFCGSLKQSLIENSSEKITILEEIYKLTNNAYRQ